MAKVDEFHTSEPETPAVYHDDDACEDGKNIKPEHWRAGKGTNRRLCKVCEGLS